MISVMVPSRGRPDKLERLILSLIKNSLYTFELVVWLDEDDVRLPDYMKMLSGEVDADISITKIFIKPRANTTAMWNFLAAQTAGSVIVMACDDMECHTQHWDLCLLKEIPEDNIFFGSAATGGGEVKFMGRKGYDILGFYQQPTFDHWYCTTWLCDLYERLGRNIIVPCEWTEERITDDETNKHHIREDYKYVHQDSANYRDNGPRWTEEVLPKFPPYLTTKEK